MTTERNDNRMTADNRYTRFSDELQEAEFKRLSSFIYHNYGINLYPAKRVLLQSRLQKRLIVLGHKTYKQYCDYVLNENTGPGEYQEMIECITTNKTEFFREIRAFDFSEQVILPEYINNGNGNGLFKVWSAGTSTGKEAYTIAMLLSEFARENSGFDYMILASDISIDVLKTARMAIYPMADLNEIPIEYQKKYLLKSKNSKKMMFRMIPEIREKVKYFSLNLLNNDYGIKDRFDIIFCRNTMIYFDRPTQQKIIHQFIRLLKPKAYLVLGQSESLINLDINMKQVAPSIYRKE